MTRKRWMRRSIALTLSTALITGLSAPPAIAEASTESIIGAVIGGRGK